ncbi:hypothetical protein D3C76_1677390 [compost metagenome]
MPVTRPNNKAAPDSNNELGKASRSMLATGVPKRIDSPRSPCSAALSQVKNCIGRLSSSPSCWRKASRALASKSPRAE